MWTECLSMCLDVCWVVSFRCLFWMFLLDVSLGCVPIGFSSTRTFSQVRSASAAVFRRVSRRIFLADRPLSSDRPGHTERFHIEQLKRCLLNGYYSFGLLYWIAVLAGLLFWKVLLKRESLRLAQLEYPIAAVSSLFGRFYWRPCVEIVCIQLLLPQRASLSLRRCKLSNACGGHLNKILKLAGTGFCWQKELEFQMNKNWKFKFEKNFCWNDLKKIILIRWKGS